MLVNKGYKSFDNVSPIDWLVLFVLQKYTFFVNQHKKSDFFSLQRNIFWKNE